MPRHNVYLHLVDDLDKISSDRLELSQATGLKELPSLIVGAAGWDEASLRKLLCLASARIPDRAHKVANRRRAARLALGVERGHEKSLKEAASEIGRSARESQPSRRRQLTLIWEDVALALLELGYETLRPSDQVDVLIGEGEVAEVLIHYIRSERPSSLRFLELSAFSVSHVLASAMQSPDARDIKLLIADPRMLSPFHWEKRMLPTLYRLELAFNELQSGAREQLSLEVRCYGFRDKSPSSDSPLELLRPDVMPSLRGRSFDDSLLNLGWYTYAPEAHNTQASDSPAAQAYPVREVWGHFNPVMLARPEDAGFASLLLFFNQQFDAIWGGRVERSIPPAASLVDAVAVRDKSAFKDLEKFLELLSGPGE